MSHPLTASPAFPSAVRRRELRPDPGPGCGSRRPLRWRITDTHAHLESTTFTPFARLALAHAVGLAGDVFVTVSLAGTLFFDVGVGAARPKVLLYLVITMAPFAVVAPVLGPFLDRTRGGRRLMVALSMIGRAALCLLMANRIDSPLLYPLAFGALVLSKGQSVAKSSLVPAVVDSHEEFVLANSRLAIISVLGATIAGPLAAIILKTAGAPWVLRAGAIVFVFGTVCAFGIPRAERVGSGETTDERAALQARSIVTAGTAMGLLRAIVGFFTFFAVFALKRAHEPAWVFGLVLAASVAGNGLGTVLAPFLRRKFREEWMLAGASVAAGPPVGHRRPGLRARGARVRGGDRRRRDRVRPCRVRQPAAARRCGVGARAARSRGSRRGSSWFGWREA